MSYKELASTPSTSSQDEVSAPQAKQALKVAQTTVDSLQVSEMFFKQTMFPILRFVELRAPTNQMVYPQLYIGDAIITIPIFNDRV